MRWKIKPISKSISNLDERVTALNNNFANSVCSKRVALTTADSVRITASNHRQGFLIFGGLNSATENMMCLISIDGRMQNPLVLNLGSKAVKAAYGDSNIIINVTLSSWSDMVVLSEKQFDVSTI